MVSYILYAHTIISCPFSLLHHLPLPVSLSGQGIVEHMAKSRSNEALDAESMPRFPTPAFCPFSNVQATRRAINAVDVLLPSFAPATTRGQHRLSRDHSKRLPRAGQTSLGEPQATAAASTLAADQLRRHRSSPGKLRRGEAHGGSAVPLAVGHQRRRGSA